MDDPKTKAELLDAMRAKRAAWESLLDEVGEARMLEPGVDGEWAVKDVIAHVTVYERWTLNRLQTGLRGEQYVRTELDQLEDVDQRNAGYHAIDSRKSLAQVRAEAQEAYAGLLALVESVSDDDLHNPARFGLRADAVPLDMIAGNGFGHYEEHIPQIRAWLDRQ